MRRAPVNILLRRAHLVLMLAGLVPTVAMTAAGILLIVMGGEGLVGLVVGVLSLAFCTSAVTGYILGSVFLSRGASVARFQNDYLSAVSHELNTPLTSIRMFIETLRREDDLDPAEKNKCLELLSQEMERLNGLVARLFDLSRMETGRHTFDRERVVIDDLFADTLLAFDAATLTHPVEIQVQAQPGLTVAGDHAALTQALTNLLTNAWKYTPASDKQISLRAARAGKWIEITVADNGPGIGRMEQRRIFEQFERGKASGGSGIQGAGLGLAIVRAIVRGHRGRLELSSRPGQGSEFFLRLRPYSEQ